LNGAGAVSDGTARRGLAWDLAALLPSLALVVLALAGPIQSGDLWWHVRVGDWIRAEGALPWQDPFSHTAGDALYVPQEYGSQVVLSLLHGWGGPAALKAFGALLGATLVLAAFAVARRRLNGPQAAALAALFAALYSLRWELRPHLVSTLFLLWFQARLFPPRGPAEMQARAPDAAGGPDRRTIAAAALLTLVWVQLHAEAVFAPLWCALGLTAAVLGGAFDRWKHRSVFPARRVGRWALAFGATLTASLLSPLGWWPHRYALEKRQIAVRHVDEWARGWTWPGHARFPVMDERLFVLVCGAFVLALAVVVGFAIARRRDHGRTITWERLALLAACLYFALAARRYFWLLWLPLLDGAARRWGLGHGPQGARAWIPRVAAVLLSLPLALSHLPVNAARALSEGRYTEVADRSLLPVHAADLLAELGPPGNLFHPYDWGGYLLYRLGPANPIFIDGRTTLFEHVIPERWHAEHDPAVAREVFERRDVRAIVARRLVQGPSGPFAWRPPDADRAWVRVWADRLAEVWVRADQREALAAWQRRYAAEGVPFEPSSGFVELAAAHARPEWIDQKDLFDPAVAARLAPHLAALPPVGAGDPAPWLALAEAARAMRLGRSARWAETRAAEEAATRR
jgi:hypothetical protein